MRQAWSGFVSKSSISFKAVMIVALAMAVVVGDVASSMAAKSAAIVVDAKTGKVLYSSDANGRRYPASLTKMMTLYLTFEALAKGRISKNTPVPFSARAAAEPPTKLGVKAGGSVSVETAILSMVTKSANDSATALGELLGGSEPDFARMMTAKARQLGMNGTVFRNANGLPDPGQFTTAHDMAMLGIALREHFPQYYGYFSQRSFLYGRQRINGHNRLLGRIKGVDGIKTGYTRASGFNLVSSVSDGNRRLVAVVMGGSSGRSRDNQMAGLINAYMPRASTRGGGALVAKAGGDSPIRALAKVFLPKHDAPTPDEKPAVEEDMTVCLGGRQRAGRRRDCSRRPDQEGQDGGRRRRDRGSGAASRGRLCRAGARARSRPGQHRFGAVGLGDPGRFVAKAVRSPGLPRQDEQAGAQGPGRCGRLHRRLRQGRRDLLPRPVWRLRFEGRCLERLQCFEEEENRVLRRPTVGRRSRYLPGNFCVEGD